MNREEDGYEDNRLESPITQEEARKASKPPGYESAEEVEFRYMSMTVTSTPGQNLKMPIAIQYTRFSRVKEEEKGGETRRLII